MRAGKLRHKVILQKPIDQGDSVTDDVPEYEDVMECWAEVRPATVREIFAAQGFIGKDDVMVTVRYDPRLADLNHTWKIWFDNRKLNVTGKKNPDMRNRMLIISTTWDQGDIRLQDKDFDDPLHHTGHVVLPELTEDS